MKKTLYMTVVAAALIVTAGCGKKQTNENRNLVPEDDTQTVEEETFQVLGKYSEDLHYQQLAEFLAKHYQIPEEEWKETRYYYNYVDLNQDGADEIVAVTIGDTTSNARGDAAIIIAPQQDGDFLVLGEFLQIHTPITVCDTMQDGWAVLMFPVYGGGQESGFINAVYREQIGYQLDETSFVREEPDVSGSRILSDNLIYDMDTDNYLTLAPNDLEREDETQEKNTLT